MFFDFLTSFLNETSDALKTLAKEHSPIIAKIQKQDADKKQAEKEALEYNV